MNRPTCGTCPHRVRYRDSYGCARETPRSVIVGDTVLAAAPYVPPDYPGCQYHPAMGKWLASREESAAQPTAESKPQRDDKQRYGYRQPEKTLSDELAELSVVREWLLNLPYPPTGETLAERLGNLSAEWTRAKSAPRMDAPLAELEQWRKAFVWHKDSIDNTWSLVIVRNGSTLSYVTPRDGNCNWLVGRGGQPCPSRDAAMRAAEAPFGLPPCRVDGEL